MSAIYQRCKYFEQPFVYICENRNVKDFCYYCLRKPKAGGGDFFRIKRR